jgi:hypothetical protein
LNLNELLPVKPRLLQPAWTTEIVNQPNTPLAAGTKSLLTSAAEDDAQRGSLKCDRLCVSCFSLDGTLAPNTSTTLHANSLDIPKAQLKHTYGVSSHQVTLPSFHLHKA